MPRSRLRESDWKDGFLFLGNNLALDFLNTRPVIDGAPQELLPDFPALLRWFRAARLLDARFASRIESQYGTSRNAKIARKALLAFREQFRTQIVLREKGKDIDPKALSDLNRLLALHPLPSRLTMSGKHIALSPVFAPSGPEDLFAPIVHSAAELLAHADPSRIRQCAACVLHFLDTSKKGTRRWCSMQLCGNRLKVAAYHARQRSS
jgi:predicted RNA-binding Zn ribbon-like protein